MGPLEVWPTRKHHLDECHRILGTSAAAFMRPSPESGNLLPMHFHRFQTITPLESLAGVSDGEEVNQIDICGRIAELGEGLQRTGKNRLAMLA